MFELIKKRMKRFGTLCALLVIAFGLEAQPRINFNFQQYMDLKSGDEFTIIASTGSQKGKPIGSGKIYQLNANKMHLQFKASPGAFGVQGEVRVQYLQRQGSKIKLRLSYRGVQGGLSRQNNEIVLVDAFLADNGILSMHYANRKYFLQLSRNRSGHNKFITDWGSARLIKK